MDEPETVGRAGGLSDVVRQIAMALQLPADSPCALPLLRSINARVSQQLSALGPVLFSPLVPSDNLSATQALTFADNI